jgi:hypothetical protein
VLNKSLSFNIHDNLLVPFVVLLILHIIFSVVSERTNSK